VSESKKDVVLARNLLFPKLKAVDFHSIEFNSSNPQEDIYSDVDGNWYYTQYPMVSITKSFTDLTFNQKISELLTANNFDQNNLKVRGQSSSWQEGNFTIQTNSTGNNLNTITITNDNYAHAEAITFKETDLTNKTYNLDWIIGFKIFDGDITTYQISAPIQGGNSGGPLFDDKGNFIGINSSGINKKLADNVGYSIKTSYVLNLIDILPKSIDLPSNKKLVTLPLTEQIKEITKYVVLVKVK
jgi:hypothetical protein